MKKHILAALIFSITALSANAQDGDLTLQGAKWVANFQNYVCAAFTPGVSQPQGLAKFNVVFEKMVTDASLDNGLITATFKENGKVCRYSAIVLADNTASTVRLVESKAFALADNTECSEGKMTLDKSFESNDYLYYGHPHNLSIMIPVDGAADVCGAGATRVGVTFVVAGKLPQQ